MILEDKDLQMYVDIKIQYRNFLGLKPTTEEDMEKKNFKRQREVAAKRIVRYLEKRGVENGSHRHVLC